MQKAGGHYTVLWIMCDVQSNTNKSLFYQDPLGAISIPWITAGIGEAVSAFVCGMLKFSLCLITLNIQQTDSKNFMRPCLGKNLK